MTSALASLRRQRGLAPNADPNVIPFIDVLLVLLVIFMVTAPKPTTDMQLDMPTHTSRSQIVATIVDVLPAEGGVALSIGGDRASFETLGSRVLANAMGANPTFDERTAYAFAPVYVRADQDIAYANVVAVLEALHDARFRKVGIFAQEAE